MPVRPIRYVHRGQRCEVVPESATRSLLDHLREDLHCTGTKEGCNEGDCGACTVVLGELDADGQAVQLKPVNACIQLLPALDGKALFTVEDLQPLAAVAVPDAPDVPAVPTVPATDRASPGPGGAAQAGFACRPGLDGVPLHPVQQALVDCHGSQCGFCTPGFAMTLWALYEGHTAQGRPLPDRAGVADALAGNLCRCTGYRPILDAAQQMAQAPVVRLPRPALVQALQALRADPPLVLRAAGAAPDAPPAWQAPRSLQALADARLAAPEATLVAGSTDIGLWVTKQHRALPQLIATTAVAELRQIAEVPGPDGRPELVVGAAATLEDAWAALAQRWPELHEVWRRFAGPPVRHAGTLGGNLANGSPIGDGAPVLMALDAQLLLRRGAATRRLPLDRFYLGYMRNALQPGEFVQAIVLPAAVPGRRLRAWKISKRFDCDISAVSAGLAIGFGTEQPEADSPVTAVRLAFGGMAATVCRAAGAEAALLGRPWTEATLRLAQQALAQDFTPLTDMRASAAYRRRVAANLLRRFWLETRPVDPLPPGLTRAVPLPDVPERPDPAGRSRAGVPYPGV